MPLRAVLSLILLCFPLRAADSFDSVREFIRAELTRLNAASVAVAVACDGRIVWEEGFGLADREAKIPATPDTPYSLASISKTFTATALMTLVQRGKIDLDRPVDEYLGASKLHGRAADANGATVRRVANHSAGLPLHYQFFYADEALPAADDGRDYPTLCEPRHRTWREI
jgi:CubicO group peptidase (beta-lactamase class C family)